MYKYKLSCLIILILLFTYNTGYYSHIRLKSINKFKIYFILLKENEERKNYIYNIIKKYNLKNYNIYEAINGKQINLRWFINNRYITEKCSNELKRGAIGCALSHMTLWEKLLNEPEEIFVIFEDDIVFSEYFQTKLKNIINNLPPDIDFCYLFENPIKFNKNKKTKIVKINKFLQKGYPQYGTLGYIIIKKSIPKLLSLCKPINSTIDNTIAENIKKNNIISYKTNHDIIKVKFLFQSSICENGEKVCSGTIS